MEDTKALEAALEPEGVIDTDENMQQRCLVLSKLNELVQAWVKKASKEEYNFEEEAANQVDARLFTFGSYRLGVQSRYDMSSIQLFQMQFSRDAGDIDTLLCFPHHIKRESFFGTFYQLLKETPGVTDLHAAEGAFVPVIKLAMDGVELDLLFASLPVDRLEPTLSLQDVDLLKKIHEDEIMRSINGCRVADAVLEVMPSNLQTFRTALRAVKLWAKHNLTRSNQTVRTSGRGVYSNVHGYFGGIHLVILVTRICQLYPNAAASTILCKFFRVYSDWYGSNWIKHAREIWLAHGEWMNSPIKIKDVDDLHLGKRQWDPRSNPRDRYDLMPIITPVYPQQNAAFNVNESTLHRIVTEFSRGHRVCQDIMRASSNVPWSAVWEPIRFFDEYQYFVRVVASAATESDRTEFEGLVESTVRHLVLNLQYTDNVAYAMAYPKAYHEDPVADKDGTEATTGPWRTAWYLALEFGIKQEGRIEPAPSKLDLQGPLVAFYGRLRDRTVTMSRYDETTMNVDVQAMKQSKLPGYLYPGGVNPHRKVRLRKRTPFGCPRFLFDSSTHAPPAHRLHFCDRHVYGGVAVWNMQKRSKKNQSGEDDATAAAKRAALAQ
ncbi:uncharacterized protein MONBRDRAFT_29366 [Monosiga brevicollis MX1]|uniref:Poly(A) polymerase n=1 Tax=Monosiga brevicollis TaxID=81824 RepID=A9VAW0_MONBE|nr:uncharacterized protein MONBRDRAFT_29366 [Monosiga brevicollis MX1]EDQ85233.1 predicted protein [Monosiga brevicollis MX1]|eukprot:XP_001749854.1 hypothetical protein [Monosiga brevicollis MX1]